MNEGIKTFIAGEALEARRRVKIESGTVTTPPEVVYADAGEDYIGVTEYAVADGDQIAVRMNSYPGTFEIECIVDSAIARGTVLYGANDGRVSDTAVGTAQGISLEAGEDNAIIEVAPWNIKATTAATVSHADAGDHFAAAEATVEAALQKLAKTIVLNFAAGSIATAAADAKIAEDLELPVPVRVKRAYATVGTAPGTGKTLTVEIKVGAGADAVLCTVAGTATKGESEALDIAIAANTDFDIQLTQDTGAAADLNLMLIAQVDDGE
ncbi:MAG TPA: hypothetical protein VLH60_05140 [Sedimentisphaerales bacterium]|nr:hypothetical protein [Sedimentisphaerales bacterium]